ncbi:MAG: type V CRISPR-associated protein Cas12d/CasY [Patescibacteria group bacterium]
MVGQDKITGYRLHKDRILFSGGKVIRTIKFPLVPLYSSEENKEFLKKFEEAVIADDLLIRGDLNLNDYLVHTAQGKTPYTLFDFWIDSLRAGAIWMSKSSELIDFIINKYNLPSLVDRVWDKASSRITDYFEKDKFKDLLLSGPVRSSSTKRSFREKLKGYLKEDFLDGSEIISSEAEEEISFIVNSFFDGDNNLVLDGKKQYEFWKNEYNLDKSIIESAKPQGTYKDITFIIIPELISDTNKSQSLEELIDYREKWLGDEKLLSAILGLENNFNGFSNFLGVVVKGLQNSEVEELYESQKIVLPFLEEHRDRVLHSLVLLSEKAKLLGNSSVPLVNGWHEYRSVFGGKLQSWFTNSQKRKKELDGQIAKFRNGLAKAKDFLSNEKFSDEVEKEKKDILDLLGLLEEFFVNEEKSIKTEANYQVFDSLLALVKRRLNFFYQAHIQKEGEDEIKVDKFDSFSELYERIYKPVAFYGVSARRANEKFINRTIPILEDGIENIEKLIDYLKESFSVQKTFEKIKREKETPEDPYRKALQFLWNKYREDSINSSVFKNKYEGILKENTEDSDWKKLQEKEQKGRFVFYKSPYAKGSLKEVKTKSGNSLESLEKLIFLLVDFLSSFKKDDLLRNTLLLLDWIELSKNVVSLLLRFNSKNVYELNDLALNSFDRVRTYVKLFGDRHYSKNEFSFIIQSLIFSEIRGAATLYSKKEYTAQYSVQVVGSDGKFRLYYIPKDDNIYLSSKILNSFLYSDERKQLMKPHFYGLSLGEIYEKKEAENFDSIALIKNGAYPVFLSNKARNYLLRLSSSPYQLQFLDKYLYRPKGWENIDITLSEWSFVVERRYRIEWDLELKKQKLLPITDKKAKRENKLYVAIPFNLEPTDEMRKSALLKQISRGKEKEEKDLSRLEYPILGVDVGEYGLAYCLVRFDNDKNNRILGIEIEKDKERKEVCGFIEDKNIANIKDKFAEIQQRAREGAFDEEDTTIAKVRENAIGALRNRVHYVVTQNGSSVVYEDSISNFETGSGRTTKIYNSVKRADTEHKSEADKQMHTHVWGDGTKWVGRNVSAYASSYTCISCLRSLFEIRRQDLSKIKILEKEGRVVTMTSPYGEVKGYLSEKEKYDEGYQFKENEEDLKIFRKIVQDFTRPPVRKDSEVLQKYARKLLDTGRIDELKKRRGSSSIFVCPFCLHVADADIQAAFIMAVRGYLRFSGVVPSKTEGSKGSKKEGEKTTGETFLEQTRIHLKDIDRSKIANVISLKV